MAVVDPIFLARTLRAQKTFRPSDMKQILTACFFGAEKFIELHGGSGEFFGIHETRYYIL